MGTGTKAAARAGLTYFALVFGIAFVFGVVRTLLLTPRIGELPAVLIEVPLVLGVSWWACGLVVRHFAVPARLPFRLLTGALAFALLMIAEFGVSVAVLGRSPGDYWAGFATPAAQLGLAAQILFALFPLWVGRRV